MYKTHGMCRTKACQAWRAMRCRCNPNSKNKRHLKNYSGRGITVCKRWERFEAFYEDMGDPPKGLTLDRIDNSKGYSKDNCRWATSKQQARNRANNRILEFQGISKSLIEWSEDSGLSSETILYRLNKMGMSVEEALTRPT